MRRTFAQGFLLGLLVSPVFAGEVVDRIVAVIGNEIITLRELDYAYYTDALALMHGDPLFESEEQISKEEYLDRMIDVQVIEQEVRRQGITVDALEIERTIDRKRESLGMTEDEFKEELSKQGITMAMYREQVRRQIIIYRLLSYEVRGEIEVTEEEIQAYYNQHPELFVNPDEYLLRMIFIPAPLSAGTAGLEEAKEKMEQIRREIEGGKDFAEMARQWSRHITAANGGLLAWGPLDYERPIRDEILPLSVGQMTPVIVLTSEPAKRGAYLFLVVEIKKREREPLEKVRETIHDILFQEKAMERYRLWLERLKAKTHIENRLRNPLPWYPPPGGQ